MSSPFPTSCSRLCSLLLESAGLSSSCRSSPLSSQLLPIASPPLVLDTWLLVRLLETSLEVFMEDLLQTGLLFDLHDAMVVSMNLRCDYILLSFLPFSWLVESSCLALQLLE